MTDITLYRHSNGALHFVFIYELRISNLLCDYYLPLAVANLIILTYFEWPEPCLLFRQTEIGAEEMK